MATTLAKTSWWSNKIQKALFAATNITAPSTVFIGLFPTDPGPSMGAATEVSSSGGSGYARVPATFTVTQLANGTVQASINALALFNPALTSWGSIGAVALFDAQTGGKAYYRGALDTPQTVSAGNQAAFSAGQLIVTEG